MALSLVVCVSTAVIGCGGSGDNDSSDSRDSNEVSFDDPNLEAVIRTALSLSQDAPIPRSDVEALESFNAASAGIVSLGGIEACTGLQGAGLDFNDISDLSPLSALPQLQYLDLNGNAIVDISALGDLPNLKVLFLNNNVIRDLSPVAGLTNLTTLTVDGNVPAISNASFVTNLTALQYLGLDDNAITDLAPMTKLTSLIALDLDDNRIVDVRPLAGLINLADLQLEDNLVVDVQALVENAGLSTDDVVDLARNPLGSAATTTQVDALRTRGVAVEMTPGS